MAETEAIILARKFGADVYEGPYTNNILLGVPAETQCVILWGEQLTALLQAVRQMGMDQLAAELKPGFATVIAQTIVTERTQCADAAHLWLMDYCKRTGISPLMNGDLFGVVGALRNRGG